MKRVLVTGGQGFVGKALVAEALKQGWEVRVTSRRKLSALASDVEHYYTGEIGSTNSYLSILQGVDVVVHCAARVHVMKETVLDPLETFRITNFHGTLNLARQAVDAGVSRFVFISSVGVNGDQTFGQPFTVDADAAPHSPYAQSKYEAEVDLMKLSQQTGLEVVIIRPPLVYGPSAPGNFASLMRAVHCGWPLPLGAINNKRSLVALDNLVDFIVICMTHPKAANQTFLVSDGNDLSTTELVRGLAYAAGVPLCLVPVPIWVLRAGGLLLRKEGIVKSLCNNLQVDISSARKLLSWVPPISVKEGLRRAVACGEKP
jgi:nucleoside-diphosphate-sugar epimerase